jgi:hypothetical protein
MIEIFSHDVSFNADEDAEGVFIISGKGWENEPFKLYVKEEEAKNLIWQMSYYMSYPDGV